MRFCYFSLVPIQIVGKKLDIEHPSLTRLRFFLVRIACYSKKKKSISAKMCVIFIYSWDWWDWQYVRNYVPMNSNKDRTHRSHTHQRFGLLTVTHCSKRKPREMASLFWSDWWMLEIRSFPVIWLVQPLPNYRFSSIEPGKEGQRRP